jgi:signal peptidase I
MDEKPAIAPKGAQPASASGASLRDDRNETATGAATGAQHAKKSGSLIWFSTKLVLVVLAFRILLFSPFSIPSESMLPNLMNGDFLLAAKWPYGYSNYSMPFGAQIIDGRIGGDLPERGDIAIFKHPVDGTDYIKRVVGLPGDTLAVVEGRVVLNGVALRYDDLPDAEITVSPNTGCHPRIEIESLRGPERTGRDMNGKNEPQSDCSYPQAQEVLPSGEAYPVIDLGPSFADNFGPVTVPQDQLFVMGDNRDNSQDSRFDAASQAGVGFVSKDLLVARASIIIWSTDGSAEWHKPWTWFSAARWDRIGMGL